MVDTAACCWVVEIVTDDGHCNTVELNAKNIEKINHSHILVDDVNWELPPIDGLSFAEVRKDDERDHYDYLKEIKYRWFT